MTAPKIFFNSRIPTMLSKPLKENWAGVTIPSGIYFRDSKKKVPTWLYKHECKHWQQVQRLGKNYMLVAIGQLVVRGYDKAKLELEAREYETQPLTAEEQSWWDKA